MAPGDTLAIWTLDRLSRNLRHLVNTVGELSARGIGLKVLTGEGALIDTSTASGRLMFGILAVLTGYEGGKGGETSRRQARPTDGSG